MRSYRDVIHISPIKASMTRDNLYTFESSFNLVESRLEARFEFTIHDHDHLYTIPSSGVAAKARNRREHHVRTVAGRYNHGQATARIIRPLDLDRILDCAAEGVAMWNCLRTRIRKLIKVPLY